MSNTAASSLRDEVLSIVECCEAGDDAGDHKFTPDAAFVLQVIEEHEGNQRIFSSLPTLDQVAAVLRSVLAAGVTRG